MREFPAKAYLTEMKTDNYRVVPLGSEAAAAARNSARMGSADHVTVTVSEERSTPCRHCLRWAEPGERVILFPYASIAPGHPYSESGPIFIHEFQCERYAATAEYPKALQHGRVIRAYDENLNMIDTVVVNGAPPEGVIETLLRNSAIAFLQVRSLDRGCYTMEIRRA